MRIFLRLLLLIAFIGNGAWFFHDPGYEPALAILNALSALVTLLVDSTTNASTLSTENKKVFKQNNGKKSINYQAESMTFNRYGVKPKNEE